MRVCVAMVTVMCGTLVIGDRVIETGAGDKMLGSAVLRVRLRT